MGPSDETTEDADVARRRFMRSIGRDALHAAGAVLGAADALRRVGPLATTRLLGLDREGADAASPDGPADDLSPVRPFRVDGDTIWLVDHAGLPTSVREIACDNAGAVAREMRSRTVAGAPALGQIAAYAVAITMSRARTWSPQNRDLVLRAAADSLEAARPSVADVRWAVRRMIEVAGPLEGATGDHVAEALRTEADAIAAEARAGHIRLADAGVELLRVQPEHTLQVATFGSTGTMATGTNGTALGVLIAANLADHPMHVWVGETGSSLEGRRLMAPELTGAGVPHSVIADAALGAMLASGRIAVLILGAERVAMNGDVCAVGGTAALAGVAARNGGSVIFAVPGSSIDPACRDRADLTLEWSGGDGPGALAEADVARDETILSHPSTDVTTADVITAFVTDEGSIAEPFGPGLAGVLERAAARRDAARAGRSSSEP
jgi:methylthioribose-1-phosphate isomerase